MKKKSNWAILGGVPSFADKPIGTSSLAKPDFSTFIEYSREFIEKGQYSNNGPLCQLLESRLIGYHQSQYCAAVSNGFWGLVLAIDTLKKKKKSEIIMPSLTYRRLADVATWSNLTPTFCDVSPETLAISPAEIKNSINSETAAILAVHPIINCCEVNKIIEIGKDSNIPVIFDSVESSYETLNGKRVGSFGDAEVFSMHASKLINGAEGGYVTSNSKKVIDSIKIRRGFGFLGPDNVQESDGINAKLNEMHAALALTNMDNLSNLISHNEVIYDLYSSLLDKFSGRLTLMKFDKSEQSSFKNIVVFVEDKWPLNRNQTVQILNAENVLARPYYYPPLHHKLTSLDTKFDSLPYTDQLTQKLFILPSGQMVSTRDVEIVVELLEAIEANSRLFEHI